MDPVVCLLYLLNLINYLTGLLGQFASDSVLKISKSKSLLSFLISVLLGCHTNLSVYFLYSECR